MSGFRKPEMAREQWVLWEQRLEDAIPADHPVRNLDFLLGSRVFTETFRAWEREYSLLEGRPPYHPRYLAGLYIYGMMNRLRSSRQLESACYNRLDVIWLMSGQKPDHDTISEFVNHPRHRKHLRKMFRDVVELLVRSRLATLEHVSLDGTKLEADAGKGSVHREETISSSLAGIEKRIEALEQEWAEHESRETTVFGGSTPWVPSREGTPAQRLARLEREQQRLKEALSAIARRRETEGRKDPPKAINSVTDPDSRTMPDKEGKSKPNYNAQVAVDAARGAIVAADISDQAEDGGLLIPMLEQVKENGGRLPEEASADSQYNVGPDLAELEHRGVVGYLPENGKSSARLSPASRSALSAARGGEMLTEEQWQALPKDGQGRIRKEAFRYDAAADVYHCPMGQALPVVGHGQDHKRWGVAKRTQYGGSEACATCPRAGMCCENPLRGRSVNRDQYEPERERMRVRMESEKGRERYALRGPTVEPRFGTVKRGLGIRRFLRRGLDKVLTEWRLICTALNIRIILGNWEEVRRVLLE